MNNILIALIEGIYIIYMFNFFKTTYNIAHPLTYFENPFLYHPIGKTYKPINMICKFGKFMSYIAFIFFISRLLLLKNIYYKEKYLLWHIYIIFISILLCLSNFNALLYLLPIFLFEFSNF